jgi:4-hydroxy-tetrahydrodipicolinate reductase
MRAVIVGYGRMGREVESVLASRGHGVLAKVDPYAADADTQELRAETLRGADAVIEFSLADAVAANARVYARTGTPAVVGTTGWDDQQDAVKALFAAGGSYLHGSNFSLGAHMFFRLTARAAALANGIEDYDALAYEIHHRNKKDSPSGTALTMAQGVLAAMDRKSKLATQRLDRAPEADELHLASLRGGSIPGIHTFMLDSAADTIEIRHVVRNRAGFAVGAVRAAEWLLEHPGFHTVSDFIDEIMQHTDEAR